MAPLFVANFIARIQTVLFIVTDIMHAPRFSKIILLCRISIMTLIGCWSSTVTPTQNGVGNSETTPSKPDSLLGEFTKASESRISETTLYTATLNEKPSVSHVCFPDVIERNPSKTLYWFIE